MPGFWKAEKSPNKAMLMYITSHSPGFSLSFCKAHWFITALEVSDNIVRWWPGPMHLADVVLSVVNRTHDGHLWP